MEPAWKNKPNPGQEAKRAKAKDAYYAGSWIYVPEKDLWLSPEEFMQSSETVNMHRNNDDANRFKIIDPKIGILEKLERIERMQCDLRDFVKRVLGYYDLKRKK